MKLSNLFTTLFYKVRTSSINTNKKICKDCRHFIRDNVECRKFHDTNIITGKITYSSARSVREDKNKCGEDAILFEENHFKIITTPYYYLKENSFIFMPFGLASLYIYILSYPLSYILHK